jgi:hypothetical protein
MGSWSAGAMRASSSRNIASTVVDLALGPVTRSGPTPYQACRNRIVPLRSRFPGGRGPTAGYRHGDPMMERAGILPLTKTLLRLKDVSWLASSVPRSEVTTLVVP